MICKFSVVIIHCSFELKLKVIKFNALRQQYINEKSEILADETKLLQFTHYRQIKVSNIHDNLITLPNPISNLISHVVINLQYRKCLKLSN